MLVYHCTIGDRPLSTQWTVELGATDEGRRAFAFFLELEPAELSGGVKTLRARARLDCDASLNPIRYWMENSHGAVVERRFESESVRISMGGGAPITVPRRGARWLLDSHMVGLTALLLTHGHDGAGLGGTETWRLFHAEQSLTVPYAIRPAPDLEAPAGWTWFYTSHDQEILVDASGRLLVLRQPLDGLEVRLVPVPPPLPDWWNRRPLYDLEVAAYSPPADAQHRLEDVRIPGEPTDIGGALTVPVGPGPHPAVLLLSGSGSHDRHGLRGPVDQGYHEIVDHLSSAGFVGLRFDKRGAGTTPPGPDPFETPFAQILQDAQSAYAYLAGRPEVDPARIFLIGHSEGGAVALALEAHLGSGAAGIALLATSGRPIDEIIVDQAEHLARQRGLPDELVAVRLERERHFIELVRSDQPWVIGQVPDVFFLGARAVKYLRDQLRYQTTDMIASGSCPVAVFHGDKDFQVSSSADGEALRAAAAAADRDVSLTVLPGLDHFFKPVTGESTLRSYHEQRHVDADFLDQLTAWLKRLADAGGRAVAQAGEQT